MLHFALGPGGGRTVRQGPNPAVDLKVGRIGWYASPLSEKCQLEPNLVPAAAIR